jgi:hypothetical protein
MKYLIIIFVFVILYLIFSKEHFDITSNLNLLTDYSVKNLSEKRIPMTMFPPEINDDEIPKQVEFDKTVSITDLQKLKAINNILDRIKEINIPKIFNPALLPVSSFIPNTNNLNFINNYLHDKIIYYSGNQYDLIFNNLSNVSAIETDKQYQIYYVINGLIDNLRVDVIVDVVIEKPDMSNTVPDIGFNELRIDNPSIYITPNTYNDNYARISNYSERLIM